MKSNGMEKDFRFERMKVRQAVQMDWVALEVLPGKILVVALRWESLMKMIPVGRTPHSEYHMDKAFQTRPLIWTAKTASILTDHPHLELFDVSREERCNQTREVQLSQPQSKNTSTELVLHDLLVLRSPVVVQ